MFVDYEWQPVQHRNASLSSDVRVIIVLVLELLLLFIFAMLKHICGSIIAKAIFRKPMPAEINGVFNQCSGFAS